MLYRKGDAQMRADSDSTGLQYEILIRLRNAGGELRMNELANQLTRTPSGLTYQVRQLEQRGYARRIRAVHDERGVLARITEAGRQFIRDQHDGRAGYIRSQVVEPLTPEELNTLHALLGKLQIRLRGEAVGGMTPELAEQVARTPESDAEPVDDEAGIDIDSQAAGRRPSSHAVAG
jgi:DNA-binding MarR family transcriptional regulator